MQSPRRSPVATRNAPDMPMSPIHFPGFGIGQIPRALVDSPRRSPVPPAGEEDPLSRSIIAMSSLQVTGQHNARFKHRRHHYHRGAAHKPGFEGRERARERAAGRDWGEDGRAGRRRRERDEEQAETSFIRHRLRRKGRRREGEEEEEDSESDWTDDSGVAFREFRARHPVGQKLTPAQKVELMAIRRARERFRLERGLRQKGRSKSKAGERNTVSRKEAVAAKREHHLRRAREKLAEYEGLVTRLKGDLHEVKAKLRERGGDGSRAVGSSRSKHLSSHAREALKTFHEAPRLGPEKPDFYPVQNSGGSSGSESESSRSRSRSRGSRSRSRSRSRSGSRRRSTKRESRRPAPRSSRSRSRSRSGSRRGRSRASRRSGSRSRSRSGSRARSGSSRSRSRSTSSTGSDSSGGWADEFPYEENVMALSRYYDFVKRLYTCDNAVTYKAVDKASGKCVVIKICHDFNPDKDPKEVRLLTTAQRHERISTFLGWHALSHTSCHAVVLEWVPNAHIDEELFGRPSKIRQYTRDMLLGLQHLHERGILYRDCKPSNVLWNHETKHAVIIDFDVSTYYSKQNLHRSIVGTDGYMAPEVLEIQEAKRAGRSLPYKGYGLEVDVYSAGIVLAQLLFEYNEDDVADLNNPDAKGPAFRERCRSALKHGGEGYEAHELCMAMLESDPRRRIRLKDALRHPYFSDRVKLPRSLKRADREHRSERLARDHSRERARANEEAARRDEREEDRRIRSEKEREAERLRRGQTKEALAGTAVGAMASLIRPSGGGFGGFGGNDRDRDRDRKPDTAFERERNERLRLRDIERQRARSRDRNDRNLSAAQRDQRERSRERAWREADELAQREEDRAERLREDRARDLREAERNAARETDRREAEVARLKEQDRREREEEARMRRELLDDDRDDPRARDRSRERRIDPFESESEKRERLRRERERSRERERDQQRPTFGGGRGNGVGRNNRDRDRDGPGGGESSDIEDEVDAHEARANRERDLREAERNAARETDKREAEVARLKEQDRRDRQNGGNKNSAASSVLDMFGGGGNGTRERTPSKDFGPPPRKDQNNSAASSVLDLFGGGGNNNNRERTPSKDFGQPQRNQQQNNNNLSVAASSNPFFSLSPSKSVQPTAASNALGAFGVAEIPPFRGGKR